MVALGHLCSGAPAQADRQLDRLGLRWRLSERAFSLLGRHADLGPPPPGLGVQVFDVRQLHTSTSFRTIHFSRGSQLNATQLA